MKIVLRNLALLNLLLLTTTTPTLYANPVVRGLAAVGGTLSTAIGAGCLYGTYRAVELSKGFTDMANRTKARVPKKYQEVVAPYAIEDKVRVFLLLRDDH